MLSSSSVTTSPFTAGGVPAAASCALLPGLQQRWRPPSPTRIATSVFWSSRPPIRSASRPWISAVMIAWITATRISTGASAPSTRRISLAGQSSGCAARPQHHAHDDAKRRARSGSADRAASRSTRKARPRGGLGLGFGLERT